MICLLTILSFSGLGTKKTSPLNTSLNRTRKVLQTKADIRTITKSTQLNKPNWSKMKSDLMESKNVSIKSRLTLKNRQAAKTSVNTKTQDSISSVFDRLGFNN